MNQMESRKLAACLLLVLSACSHAVSVFYDVKVPGGTKREVIAEIVYLHPTRGAVTIRRRLPWKSQTFEFNEGSKVGIRARVSDMSSSKSLQCAWNSDQGFYGKTEADSSTSNRCGVEQTL